MMAIILVDSVYNATVKYSRERTNNQNEQGHSGELNFLGW